MTRNVRLGDVAHVKHGFAFAGTYFRDAPPGDFLVTPGNFDVNGGFNLEKRKFYDGPEVHGYYLKPADLIVTMTDLSKNSDTLGLPALVPNVSNPYRFLHNQRIGLVKVTSEAIDKGYLYYLLRSRSYRSEILASATGTTVKHTSPSRIEAFQFDLPSLFDQRRTAAILGALDDKIELNRKMSVTLESIARALFKSWFVDFDPVVAKAESRSTNLPSEIAALFPDAFERSELGDIPAGWKRLQISRLLKKGIGGVWGEGSVTERATFSVSCLRGIDCHDLSERRIPSVPVRHLSEKQLTDRALRGGEILIEGSGSFCGRSVFWLPEFDGLFPRPVVYSNFCKRLDPLADAAQSLVLWMHISATYRSGGLDGYRVGTAFPNFDINGFLSGLMITMPPLELCKSFYELFRSLLRTDLLLQSRTLLELRDSLLPKLISGELRVRDAEQVIEQAV